MELLKLIGGLVILIAAFVFTFVFPGSGFEETIISVGAYVFGALGLKSWRQNYGLIKEWFESKTIIGALVVVVPGVALLVLPLLGVWLPEWAVYVLTALATIGGGTVIWGIFDAVKQNKKLNE